jgi:6-phosphogluconolactonase
VPGSLFPTIGTRMQGDCAAVTPGGRTLLVADLYKVYSCRIDQVSGALTLASALPAPVGTSGMAMDPRGRFAYLVGSGPGALSTYSIDPSSGRVALDAATPKAPDDGGTEIARAPDRRFAWVSDGHQVALYRVQSGRFSGPLAAWPAALATIHLAVGPHGKSLCAPQGGHVHDLFVCPIESQTGMLSPVTGSPYPISGPQPVLMVTSH